MTASLGRTATGAWWAKSPRRWYTEQHIAKQLLREFRCGIEKGKYACIEGVLDLKSQSGHVYDSVKVRLEYPYRFPRRNQPPNVVVLSHRDKWKPSLDAHMFSDWSLCLFVPFESKIDFRRDDSLNALIAVMRTFLFKEWIYQRALAAEAETGVKAEWPGEARSHGVQGIIEAVRAIGGGSSCPCGSGKRFASCCKPARLRANGKIYDK
jgi:hypothetical protein